MNEKKAVKISDYTRLKNTPGGVTMDTDIGAFVVAKILEQTGNDKALKVFETLRKISNKIDDNILAH